MEIDKMELTDILTLKEITKAKAELEYFKAGHLEKAFYLDYVNVYGENGCGHDCTNGGETSKNYTFILFTHRMSRNAALVAAAERNLDFSRCLQVVKRIIGNSEYIHARPLTLERLKKWHMMGGNFVYSCDSRYKEVTGIPYPVPVHDRIEG